MSNTSITRTQNFDCDMSDHVCINNTRSRIELLTVYFDSRTPSKFTYTHNLFDYHTRDYNLNMGFSIFLLIVAMILLIQTVNLKRKISHVNRTEIKCEIDMDYV